MQKPLVHKPGTGPSPHSLGGQKNSGRHCSGGVRSLPSQLLLQLTHWIPEMSSRKKSDESNSQLCQHGCVFRVSSQEAIMLHQCRIWEFITVAMTLISNTVPIGTRLCSFVKMIPFIQSSKKTILSIPPAYSLKEKRREEA